jgi:hypothetical protein
MKISVVDNIGPCNYGEKSVVNKIDPSSLFLVFLPPMGESWRILIY